MINVLLRTERIIVCFIEIVNIGNLLALRKSDAFDIKPKVETSIVIEVIVIMMMMICTLI